MFAILYQEKFELFASSIAVVGMVLCLAGWAGSIIAIYRESESWAFGAFVLDIILLIGAIKYWRQTRRHVFLLAIGLALVFLSNLLVAVASRT